jgi:hypothetical protein
LLFLLGWSLRRRLWLSAVAARTGKTPISRLGAVRRIRTRLSLPASARTYAEQSSRHSARAAAGFSLKVDREVRLRSELKWMTTEAWTAANFCKLRMRRKRSIARSRRRNGMCEFFARLFSQRPVPCLSVTPSYFSAALYDQSRSLKITSGRPCFRIAFLLNLYTAFLSRALVTKLSRTTPS